MRAFTEFKEANDENLKKRDALLESWIDKINQELDRFEEINQKPAPMRAIATLRTIGSGSLEQPKKRGKAGILVPCVYLFRHPGTGDEKKYVCLEQA